RSILDFGSIWETLSCAGVEFVSVNEKFDTSTPGGRAMLYIIMVFAQLERETIAERIKDNYYQRVKKGAWPGGPAPFGFRIADKKVNGICVIEPAPEIETVKKIFAVYSISGMSLGKVAKRLTLEGVPCAKHAVWDNVSVFRILRNPAYVKADIDVYLYYRNRGLIIYNDPADFAGKNGGIIVGKRLSGERKYADLSAHLFALGAHEGVIDSQEFLACQYKLDANRQIKNTGKGRLTWLSGLMHCESCGYSLKVQREPPHGRLRLVCSGRTNYYACGERHTETVEQAEAFTENAILDYIKKSRLNPDRQKKDSDRASDENALKLSLLEAEEKISNLIKALSESNGVTMKYINAELLRLDEEKKRIIEGLSALSVSVPTSPFVIDFPSLSFEDKKAAANMMIKKVYCSPSGFRVEWK
ncbi:MAG TPA: recombinase family protein, partial [Clostridia bacterium]|nr:recombinase family protein [Clostridia bacterium]